MPDRKVSRWQIFRGRDLLQSAANIAVVVASACVVWAVIVGGGSRREPVAPKVYEPGDTFEAVEGLDLSSAPRTLLMALREDCTYCKASQPFYRRLSASVAKSSSGAVRLVVVTTDDSDQMLEHLTAGQVRVDQVVTVPFGALMHIPGMPMLVLADSGGKVHKVWRGRLSPKDEAGVIEALGLTEETR